MRARVEVVCTADDGREARSVVFELERHELTTATLGLRLEEGKQLLSGVQKEMVEFQAASVLARCRHCAECGRRLQEKSRGTMAVRTVFGRLSLPNPRWRQCSCRPSLARTRTFRPMTSMLTGRVSPELLYLETKWASLLPYARVGELLREVLPGHERASHEAVRRHLVSCAERLEAELGEEPVSLGAQRPGRGEKQAAPDGPMTVGIDGGYVRAAHKRGFFVVIAGKSVVAFRRRDAGGPASSKCFGFVQSYDKKPRRRLWEVMKSQGMQDNQDVVFLSDGGEDLRQLQTSLHPRSQHVLDWFHIAMRVTVLQQQARGAFRADPDLARDALIELERAKHWLWHGNVARSLKAVSVLRDAIGGLWESSQAILKVTAGLLEFEAYIRNNRAYVANFGERYRNGEVVSTAFVESTVNQVVSKRFVKKQQMQWTPRGAHLLLQTRTRVLNGELEDAFRRWYPGFREAA